MELNNAEVESVANTIEEVKQMHVRELEELQLVCIGGGVGEVVWA